ncbi:hypothetical protein VNO77_23309 [Canavalia gladiata]|uniref:Uncharacterized protein n=1 Tax=Canavalia gladiata TaxID=3824 RepID=A0AAN9L471_CANGL
MSSLCRSRYQVHYRVSCIAGHVLVRASKMKTSEVSGCMHTCPYLLLDIKNNGKSMDRKLSPPHNMDNAVKHLGQSDKLKVGLELRLLHATLGRKVALQFAESCNHGDKD